MVGKQIYLWVVRNKDLDFGGPGWWLWWKTEKEVVHEMSFPCPQNILETPDRQYKETRTYKKTVPDLQTPTKVEQVAVM